MSKYAFNWKDVPCHFTWGMDHAVKPVQDSSFVFQKELSELHPDDEDACYMFVFLAYLEFLTCNNVDQSCLDKADKIIDKMEDESGKRAFQLVSLANRAWILSMSGESQEAIAPITSKLWSCYEEYRSKEDEKETAYLDAIEAFALRRLLLDDRAEEKFKSAVRVIPDIAMWHFELGRVAGSTLVAGAKTQNKIKVPHYEKALELKPDHVRCMAKLIDCYIRERKLDKARKVIDRLEQYDTSNSGLVICVRASFYMEVNDYDTALGILHEAESLHHSDVYKKIAITYILKAKSVSPLKRKTYLKKSLTYVDKCLSKHPGSYNGITTKFEVLCRLKVSQGEVENFLQQLNQQRPLPPTYHLTVFQKMIKIFEEVNKSNLHPDHEILIYLYESMVEVALQRCLENDSNGNTGKIVTTKDQLTLKFAKAAVDTYLKKNKELDDILYERFREANERLFPHVNNTFFR